MIPVIGIDIGQKREPTAIAVAEIDYRPPADPARHREPDESHYVVRHLERPEVLAEHGLGLVVEGLAAEDEDGVLLERRADLREDGGRDGSRDIDPLDQCAEGGSETGDGDGGHGDCRDTIRALRGRQGRGGRPSMGYAEVLYDVQGRVATVVLVRRRPVRAVTLSAVVAGLLSLVPLVIAPDPGPLRLLTSALLALSAFLTLRSAPR